MSAIWTPSLWFPPIRSLIGDLPARGTLNIPRRVSSSGNIARCGTPPPNCLCGKIVVGATVDYECCGPPHFFKVVGSLSGSVCVGTYAPDKFYDPETGFQFAGMEYGDLTYGCTTTVTNKPSPLAEFSLGASPQVFFSSFFGGGLSCDDDYEGTATLSDDGCTVLSTTSMIGATPTGSFVFTPSSTDCCMPLLCTTCPRSLAMTVSGAGAPDDGRHILTRDTDDCTWGDVDGRFVTGGIGTIAGVNYLGWVAGLSDPTHISAGFSACPPFGSYTQWDGPGGVTITIGRA